MLVIISKALEFGLNTNECALWVCRNNIGIKSLW